MGLKKGGGAPREPDILACDSEPALSPAAGSSPPMGTLAAACWNIPNPPLKAFALCAAFVPWAGAVAFVDEAPNEFYAKAFS